MVPTANTLLIGLSFISAASPIPYTSSTPSQVRSFSYLFGFINVNSRSENVFFFCYVGVKNDVVYETSQALMEKLAVEAFQVAMVFSYLLLLFIMFWSRKLFL